MNPCTEHYTLAACAAAGCANGWTEADYHEAVASRPSERETLGELIERRAMPPPDRAATSLGTLDAHGLAGLHAVVVNVINCDMYDLSDNGSGVVDAERLASDIIAEVVRRAAVVGRQHCLSSSNIVGDAVTHPLLSS